MKTVGVITGDFVGTSKLDDDWRIEMLSIIENVAEEFQHYRGKIQFEFYRGDSFQMLVERPEQTLLMAILLRAALCNHTHKNSPFIWDARVAVGIGEIIYKSKDLARSNGDAFVFSGRTLDSMKNKFLAIKTSWKDVNDEFAVSTPFADEIISNWTIKQAGLMYDYLLSGVSQFQLAIEKNMTAQNVNNILKAAKAELIINYLKRFEKVIHDRIF